MALTVKQWLEGAGYSLDWYNKLDEMHRMQVEQAYRGSEDDQGQVQSVSASAKKQLTRIAAGLEASQPDAQQEAVQPTPKTSTTKATDTASLAGTTTAGGTATPIPGIPQAITNMATAAGISMPQLLSMAQGIPQLAKAQGISVDEAWKQMIGPLTHGYIAGIYNVPSALQQAQILTQRAVGLDYKTLPGNIQRNEPRGSNTYASLVDVLSQPNVEGWANDKVKQLQDRLVRAGYLKAGGYAPGVYDEYTIAGYTEILHLANMQQKTPDEMLNDLIKANAANYAKQNAQNQFSFEKPAFVKASDAQLKETLRQDLNQQFGRDPTKAELGAAMATYRSYESKNYNQYEVPAAQYAQRAAYNKQQGLAQPATPTLTQMSPSDIEASVTNQNEQSAPAQQYRGARLGLSLMDLLARG